MPKPTTSHQKPTRRPRRSLPSKRPDNVQALVDLFIAHNPDLDPASWEDIRSAHHVFFTKYLSDHPLRHHAKAEIAAHYGVAYRKQKAPRLCWSDCPTPEALAEKIVDVITDACFTSPSHMEETPYGKNIAQQIARATRRGETVDGEPIRAAIYARLGWSAPRDWVPTAFSEADLDAYPDDPNDILETLVDASAPYRSVAQWRTGDIRTWRAAQALSEHHGVDFLAEVAQRRGFKERRNWKSEPGLLFQRLVQSAAPHDDRAAWREADPYACRLAIEQADPDCPDKRLIDAVAERLGWDLADPYHRARPQERIRMVREAAQSHDSLCSLRKTRWYKRALRLDLVSMLINQNGWYRHRSWPTDREELKAVLLERASGSTSCTHFEANDLAAYAKACVSENIKWLAREMGWRQPRLWSKDPTVLRRQLMDMASEAKAAGVDSFSGWLAHDCGAVAVARRADLHREICAQLGWRINREPYDYPKNDEAAFEMLLGIFASYDSWQDLLANDFPAVAHARTRGMIDRLRAALDWPDLAYSERDRLYIWFDRRHDRRDRPGRRLVKVGTQASAAYCSSLGQRIATVARGHTVSEPRPIHLWQFAEGVSAFGVETALLGSLSAPEQQYEGDGDGYRELRWLTDDEITELLRDAWRLCLEAGGYPLSKPDLERRATKSD